MWTLPVLSAGSLITIRYSFKFWVVLVKILFLAVVVLVLDVLEEGATCCFLLTIAETLSIPNQQNDGFQKGRVGNQITPPCRNKTFNGKQMCSGSLLNRCQLVGTLPQSSIRIFVLNTRAN
jgi:hypothetical protein